MAKCVACGSETELHLGGVPVCLACARRGIEYKRIVQILHEDLEASRRLKDAASARFSEAIGDIPSGLPESDGRLRISNASREYRHALNQVNRAFTRLVDFLVNGHVPEDLK